ncbi:MAG: hypothetical protein WA919_02740 [Coleofasciculaceae cyanobacterium]
MNHPKDFSLQRPGYSVKRLTPQDADVLQRLYEQCREFFILTDGLAPSPTAAREEFDDVPEGKPQRTFTSSAYLMGLTTC